MKQYEKFASKGTVEWDKEPKWDFDLLLALPLL